MTAPKEKQKEITRISASVLVQTFSNYRLLHDRPPKEGKQELSAPSFDFGSDLLWPSERVMLLSCVSDLFTYRIRRHNLHGLTLQCMSRASWLGRFGEKSTVSRCPAEILIVPEKRNARSYLVHSLLASVSVSPSQRECRLLPRREPQKQHLEQSTLYSPWEETSADTVHYGWRYMVADCGSWLDMVLFSPHVAVLVILKDKLLKDTRGLNTRFFFSYAIAEVTKMWPTDSWEPWDPFRESERLKPFHSNMKTLFACYSVLTLALESGQGNILACISSWCLPRGHTFTTDNKKLIFAWVSFT